MSAREKLRDAGLGFLVALVLFGGGLLLAESCATVTPAMVIEDTAVGLNATGKMFVATAKGMYAHCSTRDGVFTDAQCSTWLKVERAFKAAFHASVQGWNVAADTQALDGGVDLEALGADVQAFAILLAQFAPLDGGAP